MKSIILDNGIKVQYLNRPELSLFTLNLFLLKGAVYDPPNKEGVAHFVEHILMKGPKYFKSSIEFSQFLENRGIEFDGHTTPDYICLNIKCHQSEAYKATKLMIDMLTEPSIRPTDISNEKKVIYNEIDFLSSDDEIYTKTKLRSKIWEDHPLGTNIIGYKSTIDAINQEDVINYLRYLTNDSLFITVAGNFDVDKLISEFKVLEQFINSNLKNLLNPSTGNVNLPINNNKSNTVYLLSGIAIPNSNVYSRFPYDLYNLLLGDGISSVLFSEIREKKGLVYDIWSKPSFYNLGIEYLIGYVSSIEQSREINKYIYEILNTFNITEESLEISKKRYLTKLSFIFGNPIKWAYWVGRNYSINHQIINKEKIINDLKEISTRDLNEISKQFSRGNIISVETFL